jgi:predicted nucleic acid-binding protein
MTYALDTNVISNLLWGEGNVKQYFEKEILETSNPYVIPPVVVFELRRWLLDNPTKAIRAFAVEFDVLYQSVKEKAVMTIEAWEKAADVYISLKRKGMLIGDADILIAAYCLVNDYTLVTNNVNDFSRIADLKLVNWYE